MSEPAANYRWWRQEGGGWKREIEARKRRMPIYHLQEIFLADLLRRSAPARVLEFGCGYGRHLQYLDAIPDLEVHGFDQSEAMLEQLDWAGDDWRAKRIRSGDPVGRLPYDDDSFDIVLTVSVLIHIRPEDLDPVLAELARVARGQVIHIENNDVDETVQTSTAHDGCWAHDLRAAWARVGGSFELLPKAFELEDAYRIRLDGAMDVESALPAVDPGFSQRLLTLDSAVSGELRRLLEVEQREGRRRLGLEAQTTELQGRIDDLRSAGEALETRNLEALKRARGAEAERSEAEAERAAAIQQAQQAAEKAVEALDRAREAELQLAKAVQNTRASEHRESEYRERARVSEKDKDEATARAQAAGQARTEAIEGRRQAEQVRARASAGRARAERRAELLQEDLRQRQSELDWVLAELKRKMGL